MIEKIIINRFENNLFRYFKANENMDKEINFNNYYDLVSSIYKESVEKYFQNIIKDYNTLIISKSINLESYKINRISLNKTINEKNRIIDYQMIDINYGFKLNNFEEVESLEKLINFSESNCIIMTLLEKHTCL